MKKLTRAIGVFIWIALIGTAFFLALSIEVSGDEKKAAIILELWQIDSFEGGQGSRRQYLLDVGKEFEKNNKNVLVTVVNETVESAEEKLKKGIYPHLISYGVGVEGVLAKAKDIGKTKSKFVEEKDGKILAVGWASGGYVCVKRQKTEKISKIIVSKGEYNQPLAALYYSGFLEENGLDISLAQSFSPLDGYYAFLADSNSMLVGTQRDLYRISKREIECQITPVEGFTDIVQYVSVLSEDKEALKLSREFLSLLLSYGQERLDRIGLLPAVDGFLNTENAVNQPIAPLLGVKYDKTLSLFYSKSALDQLNAVLYDKEKNASEKNKYIENALKYLK